MSDKTKLIVTELELLIPQLNYEKASVLLEMINEIIKCFSDYSCRALSDFRNNNSGGVIIECGRLVRKNENSFERTEREDKVVAIKIDSGNTLWWLSGTLHVRVDFYRICHHMVLWSICSGIHFHLRAMV